MLKIKYFDKYSAPELADFLKWSIVSFESRHAVFLTIHTVSGRWHGRDGAYLFPQWMTHRADYCRFRRYTCRKYDKACLHDCAAGVEQESLRTGQPFQHFCWKGVTELVVPFSWDGNPELIFYIGPFRGSEPPEEFRADWATLPEFPEEKQETLIGECRLLGMAFYARLLQENCMENHFSNRREIIREYILRHGCGEIALCDLAAHLGVSVSRASHLCMSLLGVSFQEQVLNVRMKKAEFLLKETDEPIKEIAAKSGFSNVFYFSRMFHRFFGTTPGKLRRGAESAKERRKSGGSAGNGSPEG